MNTNFINSETVEVTFKMPLILIDSYTGQSEDIVQAWSKTRVIYL